METIYQRDLKGPKGEAKKGYNKIIKNDKGEIIYIEYFPDTEVKGELLRMLQEATPEELIEIKKILNS